MISNAVFVMKLCGSLQCEFLFLFPSFISDPIPSLTCGHSFCAQCLYNWFTEARHECPVCRKISQVPRDDQSLRSIIEKFVFSHNHLLPPDRFDFTEFHTKFDTIFVRHRRR